VAGEIAISVILLAGAGLMTRSFVLLRGADLGFRIDHILTARVTIPETRYVKDEEVASFCERLLDRVRAVPGVESAGLVSFLPLTGRNFNNSFDIVGRPPRPPSDRNYALVRMVDPQYFGILQIPVLGGRGIEIRDRAASPRVVVISESMARRYWPGGNPVGERLTVYMGMNQSPWEIVGVVRDVRTNIAADPEPAIYFPYAQVPYRYMVLTIRTHADEQALIGQIETALQSIDPDQPLYQIRSLEELVSQTLVPWRFTMTMLGSFAALALVLAAAGIYGVISYSVGRRTAEIGIRMALGAHRGTVLRLVLRQGMSVTLAGIAVGLAGALYLTQFLTSQLYGVTPTDTLTFLAIPVMIALVAAAASYIPARRAARIDPSIALRTE
jgi:putative ABC transport system permease protein